MGHLVHATSLVRDPVPAGQRDGVVTRPLAARNPLWIEDSSRHAAPVRLANKLATVFNRQTSSEFGALLDDIRPDVLHTHSMVELPPTVWNQAARRGVPIVHTLHDYDLLCIRGALFKDGRRCSRRHVACQVLSAPKRALHDRIDVVAAVSQPVMDRHLAHGLFAGLPAERRRIVWNPTRITRQAARRPRVEGASLRFGFLGRLVTEKGLGLLLEALRQLPASGWSLQIAGDGPERAGFEQQAKGLPVSFVGHVPAAPFLSEVDVLVCAPLWDEPFGLTTLEAYAAGCRVIGSISGLIGEVVERVDPGWTVPPGDVAALSEALLRAIEAGIPLPCSRIPAAEALLQELDPPSVARTYLELYQLAKESARSRSSSIPARGPSRSMVRG